MKLKAIQFKVADVADDNLKYEAYKIIKQFVYTRGKHLYPNFDGELDDLVTELYVEFTKPTHKGEGPSLLDNFDPNATGEWKGAKKEDKNSRLASYIYRWAPSRLIDIAKKASRRTSNATINVDTNYDSDSGSASLDYFSNLLQQAQDEEFNLDELNLSYDDLAKARDIFDEMSYDEQQEIKSIYNANKEDLHPQVAAIIEDLLTNVKESDDPLKAAADAAGAIKFNEFVYHGVDCIRIEFPDPATAKKFECPEGYTAVNHGKKTFVTANQ